MFLGVTWPFYGAPKSKILWKRLFLWCFCWVFFFCNFGRKSCNKSPKALKRNSFGPKHCFLGLLSHFLCKSLVIERLISKRISQTIRVFFLNKLRVKWLQKKSLVRSLKAPITSCNEVFDASGILAGNADCFYFII